MILDARLDKFRHRHPGCLRVDHSGLWPGSSEEEEEEEATSASCTYFMFMNRFIPTGLYYKSYILLEVQHKSPRSPLLNRKQEAPVVNNVHASQDGGPLRSLSGTFTSFIRTGDNVWLLSTCPVRPNSAMSRDTRRRR